jgi:hypothetical protein
MTRQEIIEWQQRNKEWDETELGRLFRKYENATISYWQKDQDDRISDKRLRELSGKMDEARKAFLLSIRGF